MTKTQLNITSKSQEVSPLPAGDHKAAMKRRESMKNTRQTNNTNDPRKKYRLGMVNEILLLEGFNQFHGANLILISNLDQASFLDLFICWEMTKLFALLCVVFSCVFVTFLYGILDQSVVFGSVNS